jgi:hypothetical protein
VAQCREYVATGTLPEGVVGDNVMFELVKVRPCHPIQQRVAGLECELSFGERYTASRLRSCSISLD